jgi:hypothetical protein
MKDFTIELKTKTVEISIINYFSFEKQFVVVRTDTTTSYFPIKDILEIVVQESKDE